MDTLLQRLCHPYGVTQVCRELAQWPLPSPVVGTSPWIRIFLNNLVPYILMISLPLNLSLRHEVARLIVWHVVTSPVVPSAVSYADVREGNDSYRACGHGTHSDSLAPERASQ